MNEEQLRLFIRQAFALQAREGQILKAQNPALLRAMTQIRRLVETLPPEGTLFREKAWREMLPQVRSYLGPYNDEFARQLRDNLIEEAPEMAEEAAKMVEAVGAPAAPQVPTARAVPTDLGRLPIADNVAAALRSRVNGKRVADVFERQGSLLLSDWMRTNERAINSAVTRGILEAIPTQDIAESIVQISQTNGVPTASSRGPTVARLTQAQAKAIARTSVQDANRQVHEQVWKANESALSDLQWEWVAALDSRTCPICAPRDGQRWDDRKDAPEWPAHVNCRCRVVAVDPDEEADVRSGIVISDKQYSQKNPRAYKTKVKVDGETFYRKAVDIKPIKGQQVTYGDFLHSSNALSREKFFGSKAKAQRFMDLVDKRNLEPRTAMMRVIDGGKFKPDSKLGKLPAIRKKPKTVAKPKPVVKAKPKPPSATKVKIAEANAAIAKAQKLADAQAAQAKAVVDQKKAAAKAAKDQATKIATKEKALNKKGRTADTNYDYDKNWEKLGYEKRSQYRKVREDVVEWSGNEFEGVRAAQFADARDRGVELNSYERLQTRRLERGEQKSAGNRARRLEDFIGRAPKYDGTIRRGISMETREEALDNIARYSAGKKNLAIESWTTDEATSNRFAFGNGDPKPHRMTVLVENNNSGAPINGISGFDDEFEVLVPSGVRYEVVNVEEKFVKGTGKPNPISGVDHTDWTVTLREVRD